MKRNLSIFFFCFPCYLFGGPPVTADYTRGSAAYQIGDYTTALREWKILARQGDAKTQGILGAMYLQGINGAPDYKTALKWYRKAAEQGDIDAQYQIGWILYNGLGVPKDQKLALSWLMPGVEKGYAPAQYLLAWMYEQGHVVIRNRVLAYMWANIAASDELEEAVVLREKFEEIMPSSKLIEAQKRSLICVEKKFKGC